MTEISSSMSEHCAEIHLLWNMYSILSLSHFIEYNLVINTTKICNYWSAYQLVFRDIIDRERHFTCNRSLEIEINCKNKSMRLRKNVSLSTSWIGALLTNLEPHYGRTGFDPAITCFGHAQGVDNRTAYCGASDDSVIPPNKSGICLGE